MGMPVDVNDMLTHADVLSERAPSPLARGLQGSAILKIAGEVRALKATGAPVGNFTIGDFNPEFFSIPDAFRERIKAELDAGQTNYPPAVGIPELREAVRGFYADRLGLDYPEGTVQVGAGARPPIFAAFQTILDTGDIVLYPVPTWNIRYYVYLNRAEGVPIVTRPENGFMPTAEDLLPHLSTARLIVLNSPLNPCGTVIAENLLRDICEAIVDENERRLPLGERPLMLIYDQVYWQLTFEEYTHHTPVGLVPEMAQYTVLVDAISKSWAATGLRVGWAVAPPWIRGRMGPLVGHMGAWAARAEQRATAAMLDEPADVDAYMVRFKSDVQRRLQILRDGVLAFKEQGLPVDCLDAQGAIYLSVRFDLDGMTHPTRGSIEGDEAVRQLLLEEAGIALVPFTAFGYPSGTGWTRFSVGAVTERDIEDALGRLGEVLRSLR
jgi:aspartate aminotransferase